MKGVIAIACFVAAIGIITADGLSEYGNQEQSRLFYPGGDLKMAETRQTKMKSPTTRKQRPGNPQIVYSKVDGHESRGIPARQTYKKFKPSPQDPYNPSEGINYAPSHKYLQKYATQLYTAQKNSGSLSDYQKYIIGQDPTVKKFVFARVPKKLDLDEAPATAASASIIISTTIRPIATEKPVKEQKEEDSTAQSTAYKFVFQPEYIPVPVYTTQNKEAFTSYDTAAYTAGHSYNLGDQITYKIPTTTHADTAKAEEDHHVYPTKEPKYEFQYAVKDHEKKSHFGHAETRQGKRTWGKYYVQLSDGRLETVNYWADKTGYHAEVDFKGQAHHPSSQPKKLHDFSLGDLKLYGHDNVTPQYYSVSENSPIDLH